MANKQAHCGHFLLVCILGFFSSSCGRFDRFENRSDGYTDVRVGRGEKTASGEVGTKALNGGVLVYAVGASGLPQKTVLLADSSATGLLTLPNGAYKFYAVGFQTANLAGDVACGVANAGSEVALNGTATTVQIALTIAGCSDLNFAGNANFYSAVTGFIPLKVLSCSPNISDASFETFTAGMSCASGSDPGPVHVGRSLKLHMTGYSTSSGAPTASDLNVSTGISSACIKGVGVPTSVDTTAFTGSTVQGVGTVGTSIVIFTDQTNGIKRSTDGGGTWSTAVGSINARAVAVSGNRVVVSTSTDIRISDDAGANFTAAIGGVGYWGIDVLSDTIAAGFYDGTGSVRISTDGGANFAAAENVGFSANIQNIRIESTGSGNRIYASGGQWLARRSVGGTWSTILDVGSSQFVREVVIDQNRIYVASSIGLYISTDDGANFSRYCTTGCPPNNGALHHDNVYSLKRVGQMFFAGTADGLAVSEDAGVTWTSATAWNATNLAVASGQIYQIAANSTAVFFAAYNASNPARMIKQAGNGTVIPPAGTLAIPAGGASGVVALASKVTLFKDATCTDELGSFSFPNGPFSATAVNQSAVYRSDGTNVRLFLRGQ